MGNSEHQLPICDTLMGATTSAGALPDDACEAVLHKFIAEDLERAERLLRRADEQLGMCLMAVCCK